jgi:hypothetical protein
MELSMKLIYQALNFKNNIILITAAIMLSTHKIVTDYTGVIVHVESGFLGHINDAQQYALMENIGSGDELDPPPPELNILGDKIYPNMYPIITRYTSAQLSQKTRPRATEM